MARRATKTATRARGTAKQAGPASGAAKKYGGTTARARATSGNGEETSGRHRPLQYCSLQPRPAPELPPDLAAMPGRARAILRGRDKWANRTVRHYAFIGGSHQYAIPKAQADVVR